VATSRNPHDLSVSEGAGEYRRDTLFGWAIVALGIVFGAVTILALMSYGPKTHGGYLLLAMTIPTLFILMGLLIISRAKLTLWLMYLLAADLLCTFSLQVAHALKTRRSDDVYGTLLDLMWVGLWMSIVMHFHNRRQIFTSFWGSFGAKNSLNRTIHGDGN
jgi:hypothetical protein